MSSPTHTGASEGSSHAHGPTTTDAEFRPSPGVDAAAGGDAGVKLDAKAGMLAALERHPSIGKGSKGASTYFVFAIFNLCAEEPAWVQTSLVAFLGGDSVKLLTWIRAHSAAFPSSGHATLTSC